MQVILFVTPAVKVAINLNERSVCLFEIVEIVLLEYKFSESQIASFKFTVKYHTKESVLDVQILTKENASSLSADLLANEAELESIEVWWSTGDITVFPFGCGIRHTANKQAHSLNLVYSSYTGLAGVIGKLESILVLGKRRNVGDVSGDFRIVIPKDGRYETLSDNSDMSFWLENVPWFLNREQASYSELNELVLNHFVLNFPKGVSPKTWSDTYPLLLGNQAQTNVLKAKCREAAVKLQREFGDEWDTLISGALAELNHWSAILPLQYSYNEATRRLIINPCVRVSSILLRNQTVHVKAPQCASTTVPSHFVGKGPLDFVLSCPTGSGLSESSSPAAASTTASAGTVTVLHSAMEPTPEELQEMEGPSAVDSDEEEAIARYALIKAKMMIAAAQIESKILLSPAAFYKLCGECHDHAFLTAGEQASIANKVALADMVGPDIIEELWEDTEGGSSTKATGDPARAHRCVTGILSTGHMWEVFTFTTASLSAREKPLVTFMGRLSMRVLAYQTKIGAAEKSEAASSQQGSTNMPAGQVDRAEVEAVVALLVLCGRGELTTTAADEAGQLHA